MIGAILGAIGSGISSIMGMNAAKDAQKQQNAMAERNIALQKEFAQQGIRWKVEDAQRAGIHPIYALGAPTTSFAPVSIGDSLSPGIRAAGQDISRAISSTGSALEREISSTAAAIQLEKGGLENELLRTQIFRLKQSSNPPLPTPTDPHGVMPGQGNAAPVIKEKTERAGWNPSNPSAEHHSIADIGYARTPGGGWMPVPSKDVKERIEDNLPHEVSHYVRNNVMPFIGKHNPPFHAPFNQHWEFDWTDGYTLHYNEPQRGGYGSRYMKYHDYFNRR